MSPRNDRRVTPQTRECISFPANLSWMKEFMGKVAEEENLTKSDAYSLPAATYWAARYPKLWKQYAKGSKRDEFLRRLGA